MRRRREPAQWSSPATITDVAHKAWLAGTLLRATATQEPFEPVTVRLSRPVEEDLGDHWAAVREWASALRTDAAARGWHLQERRVASGIHGPQRLPYAARLDDLDSMMAMLGPVEHGEASRWRDQLDTTDRHPMPDTVRDAGRTLALAQPFEVLRAGKDWLPLLSASAWLARHPRPGIGLRELPIPGAHTKLLENNSALARALFDAVLPAEAVDMSVTDLAGRYGFDEAIQEVLLRGYGSTVGVPWRSDVQVRWPLDALQGLDPGACRVDQVWLVENKASVRRVPLAPGRLVIWGGGYAAEAIAQACSQWWGHVDVRYWGDIDTHGLICLARVLRQHPQLTPVLMDEATMLTHRAWWGTEDEPADPEESELLLPAEQARLLTALRTGKWGTRLRLEQEHLGLDDQTRAAIFDVFAATEAR